MVVFFCYRFSIWSTHLLDIQLYPLSGQRVLQYNLESEKVKLLFANDMEPLKINDILNEIQDLRKELFEAKKDMKVQLESHNLESLSTNIGKLPNSDDINTLKNEFDVLRHEIREFKRT